MIPGKNVARGGAENGNIRPGRYAPGRNDFRPGDFRSRRLFAVHSRIPAIHDLCLIHPSFPDCPVTFLRLLLPLSMPSER